MNTLSEFLAELRRQHIYLWAEGDRLRVNAPEGALTPELKATLAARKTALLAFLQQLHLAAQAEPEGIAPVSRDAALPLSFAQERLWFLSQLEGQSIAYNMPVVLRITGALEIPVLEQCLNEIMRRHEILRTAYLTVAGKPTQVIAPRLTIPLPVKDLRHIASQERETEVQRFALEEARRPFDLAQSPLWRVLILHLEATEYVTLTTFHHIIFDGWSSAIFVQELMTLYEVYAQGQPSPLPELPIQYADFAQWQQHWMQGAVLEQEAAYWKQQLAGTLPLLELPTDYPRPARQTFRGNIYAFRLPQALSAELNTVSQRADSTLFMTLLAAFATLLYRYTGQTDLIIGVPTANRNRPEIAQVIGFFVNTLALRLNLSGNPTFRELLQRVRDVTLDAQSHQEIPFEHVVAAIQPERELSRHPVFQVMFVLQNYPIRPLEIPGLRLTPIEIDNQTTKFDLTFEIRESPEGLLILCEYTTDLFEQTTIIRMLQHFQVLLEGIAAAPAQRIGALPLLTSAERRQILETWNHTAAHYPAEKCLHQLFEEQAAQTPDAVAVIFENQQLTYRELNGRANQLARQLRNLGVGPEVLVGICLERSLNLIVGLLAILKAGGAYVPLDPHYPQERLAFMCADAMLPVVLTQRRFTELLPASAGQFVYLEPNAQPFACESVQNLNSGVAPANLAYVIYTSGSTGQPKGVMIHHQALVNLTAAIRRAYELRPTDRVLQFASINFDVAAEEIYPCLTSGGTLILRMPAMVSSAQTFLQVCQDLALTVLNLPTAYWQQLTAEVIEKALPIPAAVRLVIIGGERVMPEKISQWQRAIGPTPKLVNAYGPTEATVTAAIYPVPARMPASPAGRETPIGRPLSNVQMYILDPLMQPVPVGVPGELHIGGVGLARGYLNRPELTAGKFIPNPFSPSPIPSHKGRGTTTPSPLVEEGWGEGANPPLLEGEGVGRLYKTGDLARYLPDGNIEFAGRIDQQVKIRGFRIELGEIETLLARHPAVKETAVIAREDQPGDKQLVAYVVAADSPPPEPNALRSFLKAQLPEYMLPTAFVMLAAFPLTPNGKIDRRALPEPERLRPELETAYIMPQTETEARIAAVWQELLRVDKVGMHDNFFDLGGHSLLVAQVHYQLQEIFGPQVTIVDLFQYPTIHALAQHLQTVDANAGNADILPAQGANGMEPELQKSDRLLQFTPESAESRAQDIAVIGMACRFPGAPNLDVFWQNLRDGIESITFFSDAELLAAGVAPALIEHPNYVRAYAILPEIDLFDASFFDISPGEARQMDPQQRLFLEEAWQALEHAGYATGTYPGAIGVYAGTSVNTYLLNNLYLHAFTLDQAALYQASFGSGSDFLTTRVSYKLNLTGPSVNLQTACSTSLVAIHIACQGLWRQECDLALAGGVSITVPSRRGYLYQEGMILSPDGHCRAFDAQAKGTVPGNGVGVVALKRLADAIADGDAIYAVIKGSAINNDGALKVGYTAPGVEGQKNVILRAQQAAGVAPETITYIETHGTGTILGDPIEIEALTQAFRRQTPQKGFCAIGSVKTNVGHLDAAAGVAGFIKTVLALHHKWLPPSLHYVQPNPKIDFANSPFYVNAALTAWNPPGQMRRAGVSSFGIGGTNAHVILEEAPARRPSGESRAYQLLPLSAKTGSALETVTTTLADYLRQSPEVKLADVAYTLQTGRRRFKHRRIVVCHNRDEAFTALSSHDSARFWTQVQEAGERPVVFLFPGQGAQHVNMGRELYETEPTFRAHLDHCCELIAAQAGFDLRPILYPASTATEEAEERLKQTAITQPALFALEYALAKLLQEWGIRPQAMIGHSFGEYVAACLAGVFSLEDALFLLTTRAQLMQQLPGGTMLSIPLSPAEVQPWLGDALSLAAVNTPSLCVVSGPTTAVEALQQRLTGEGIAAILLRTSHAFHSAMMEPMLPQFAETVRRVTLHPPKMPYLSTVTGGWATAADVAAPDYWLRNIRQPVRFADAVQQILAEPAAILLEVGPGKTLSTLAKRHPAIRPERVVLTALRHPKEQQSDAAGLLLTVGKLWLEGVNIAWTGFYRHEHRARLALPTYPFERQRYWVEPPDIEDVLRQLPRKARSAQPLAAEEDAPTRNAVADLPPTPPAVDAGTARPNFKTAYAAPRMETEQILVEIWQKAFGITPIGIHDNFFDFGGDSLLAMSVIAQIQQRCAVQLPAAIFFETPTIAQLAERIGQPPTTAIFTPIVRIQPQGQRRPFFCVHPIDADVFRYAELANRLGTDQPFYGLQAYGLTPATAPLRTIEAMAEKYLAAIRAVQPEGPYLLGGYSMGGAIAYEMAQQLYRAQTPVKLLVIIDTPLPHLLERVEDESAMLMGFAWHVGEAHGLDMQAFYCETQGLDPKTTIAAIRQDLQAISPAARLQRLYALLHKAEILPAETDVEQFSRLVNVYLANYEALTQYRVQPYTGNVVIFRAIDDPNPLTDDPTLGWGAYVAPQIRAHDLPGDHFSILRPPHLAVLVEKLRGLLAERGEL